MWGLVRSHGKFTRWVPGKTSGRTGGAADSLEVLIQVELVQLGVDASHHTSLLVLPHSLLKEVGLALQRDDLHPIKGVDPINGKRHKYETA